VDSWLEAGAPRAPHASCTTGASTSYGSMPSSIAWNPTEIFQPLKLRFTAARGGRVMGNARGWTRGLHNPALWIPRRL
ncbi:hypothetical protein FOZ63_013459, partial [Perkinsus olseni]